MRIRYPKKRTLLDAYKAMFKIYLMFAILLLSYFPPILEYAEQLKLRKNAVYASQDACIASGQQWCSASYCLPDCSATNQDQIDASYDKWAVKSHDEKGLTQEGREYNVDTYEERNIGQTNVNINAATENGGVKLEVAQSEIHGANNAHLDEVVANNDKNEVTITSPVNDYDRSHEQSHNVEVKLASAEDNQEFSQTYRQIGTVDPNYGQTTNNAGEVQDNATAQSYYQTANGTLLTEAQLIDLPSDPPMS